jgi:hypothetical protein
MTDQERKLLLKNLGEHTKKMTSSKKASTQYLVDLGIFTKDGQLTENYKDICIQPSQA